jgi:hypothetical protein
MSNILILRSPSDPTKSVVYNNDNHKFLFKIPKLSLKILHSDIFSIILQFSQLSFKDILSLCASFKIIGDSCRTVMLKQGYIYHDTSKKNNRYILNSPFSYCYRYKDVSIPNWITDINYYFNKQLPPSGCNIKQLLNKRIIQYNIYKILANNTLLFKEAKQQLLNDKYINPQTKKAFTKVFFETYCEEFGISCSEVFTGVWCKIINHPQSIKMRIKLNELTQTSYYGVYVFIRAKTMLLINCIVEFCNDIIPRIEEQDPLFEIIIQSFAKQPSIKQMKEEIKIQLISNGNHSNNENHIKNIKIIKRYMKYIDILYSPIIINPDNEYY